MSEAVGALRLPPKILAGIALPSGFLVFARATWLEAIGLAEFMSVGRPYVSIAFLVSGSLLFVSAVSVVYNSLAVKVLERRLTKIVRKALVGLDQREIRVLREFVLQGQSTIKLPLDEPVVAGLVQKGVLRQVGSLGQHTSSGVVFPFKINDRASDLVTYELLELPASPTEKDRQRIHQERPGYVLKMLQRDELFGRPW